MLEDACNYAMETHNALGNSGQCALELMRFTMRISLLVYVHFIYKCIHKTV